MKLNKSTKVSIILISLLLLAGILLIKPDHSVEWIRSEYGDTESKYLNINGLEVHYKDKGAGMPVILLHGTASSLHTWDGWADVLAEDFRVIRMDLPAFGITGPFHNRDYRMEHYVSFLDTFTTVLQLDTFFLAGNSLGGGIAWNYTLSYPGKVKGMCLLNASGFPREGSAGIFQLARIPVLSSILKYCTPRWLIRKNLEEVYGDDSKITDALVDRYWHLSRRSGNRQAFIDRVRTPFSDRSEEIGNISSPVLIMWGEQDQWIPVSHADRFARAIDRSKVIIYPKLGHVIMEEAPEKTAVDAKEFFKDITTGNNDHQ